MSRVIQRRWPGTPDALSRRGRMPCDYEAYVPDPLLGRAVTLDGDVAADVTDAETALTLLNAQATGDVERATSQWRHEAAGLGLPRQQIDRMADAYETAERRTARALSY
jgi:hypothetical protein